jgi:DNA-binding transcriptional LysR family regulator
VNDWDNLRLFLSLARTGTSRAAGRQLGINQSTVSRRLSRLEADAGVQLFERHRGGLRLTEDGHELLASAERIEDEFAVLGRQVLGRDQRLSGRIRFSLPDLMVAPVAPILVEFGRRYADIELELVVDNGYVDLTRREADVAIRLGVTMPEHLVGRRIAKSAAAIYAAPTYLETCEDPTDPKSFDWVRWDEAWRNIPPERWMDDNVAECRVQARVNTNQTMVELLASGAGAGFQLCYTADRDPRLRRVGAPFDFGLSLWVLTHEDVRATARISAFTSFLSESLSADFARP